MSVIEIYGDVLKEKDTRIVKLEAEVADLMDALYHSGYDPEDCIDCGGPPHNEWCRFWKL